MISCAKALTGAYMPLSALLVSERIYASMRAQSAKLGTFGHGFTYGGHPVACAVACEAIDIYLEQNIPARVRELGGHLEAGLRALEDHPLVGEVRGIGLMWGVELVADKASRAAFPADLRVGLHVQQEAFENGLVIRTLGDTLAFAPAFVITRDQIDEALKIFAAALDEAAQWLSQQSKK
jgi:4-aminobutyrate--pyruvate transaminase